MKYVLGVDGGNTKTDYFLFDTEGNHVDSIRKGTCSHEALRDSFAGTKRVMSEHLSELFERNNITVEDIEGAAFGLAGADVVSQKIELNRVIKEIGFKKINFNLVVFDGNIYQKKFINKSLRVAQKSYCQHG